MHYACIHFIVFTKQKIMVISLTDFLDAASRRHNDVILLPVIRKVSGNDCVSQQDSALAHRAAHVQQLNCCVKKRQTFLCPKSMAFKHSISQSCGLRDLGCHSASCLPQTNT